MSKIQEIQSAQRTDTSLIQEKHATPAEGAVQIGEVFQGMRPHHSVQERTSDAGVDVAAQRTEILRQYTPLEVNVEANYVQQFNSLYPSQVFHSPSLTWWVDRSTLHGKKTVDEHSALTR